MIKFVRSFILLFAIGLILPAAAFAGMPVPVLVLTELGKRRMEELSFFVMGFLLMAFVIQRLWNYMRTDFPQLPLLTYRRTVLALIVWGLAMTVVLSLISGARELMTPAAWEPNGVTYKLRKAGAESNASVPDLKTQRRERLKALAFALWQFAATHDGRFPSDDEVSEIPKDAWLVEPDGSLNYIYRSGLTTKSPETMLVFEPELYEGGQLVLMTSGRIATLQNSDLSSNATP